MQIHMYLYIYTYKNLLYIIHSREATFPTTKGNIEKTLPTLFFFRCYNIIL
jgi:hypothetical protein